eukprot:1185642-Prorocentrum_minimum.AAC.2
MAITPPKNASGILTTPTSSAPSGLASAMSRSPVTSNTPPRNTVHGAPNLSRYVPDTIPKTA